MDSHRQYQFSMRSNAKAIIINHRAIKSIAKEKEQIRFVASIKRVADNSALFRQCLIFYRSVDKVNRGRGARGEVRN